MNDIVTTASQLFGFFGPTRCIHQFEIYARIFVAGEFNRGFVDVDALQLNGLGNLPDCREIASAVRTDLQH
jgi:hypothetical protein